MSQKHPVESESKEIHKNNMEAYLKSMIANLKVNPTTKAGTSLAINQIKLDTL